MPFKANKGMISRAQKYKIICRKAPILWKKMI